MSSIDAENISALYISNDWVGIEKLANEHIAHGNNSLSVLLHLVRSLRAQNRGAEANSLLAKSVINGYQGTQKELAQFGEELVQANLYDEAANVAYHLKKNSCIEADYLLMLLWREREDWSKFKESYNSLLFPKIVLWNSIAAIQMGIACMRQGLLEKASFWLENVDKSWQKDTAYLKTLSRLYLAKGEVVKAQQLLSQLYNAQPFDWEVPTLLATAYTLIKDSSKEKILNLYKIGLDRQPRQPDALANRARYYFMTGNFEAAMIDIEGSLLIKPWWDAPLLLAANYLISIKSYNDARRMILTWNKEFKTPKRYSALLDICRLDDSTDEETKLCIASAKKAFPDDYTVLRSAGACWQTIGNIDNAAREYEHALSINPEDGALRNNYAQLLFDRGDIDEALTIWKPIAFGADVRITLNYANALLMQGELEVARSIYESIAINYPNEPGAIRGLAEVAYKSSSYELATNLAKKAIQLDNSNAKPWIILSKVTLIQEGINKSKKVLEEALLFSRKKYSLHKAFIRLLMNQGDLEAAKIYLDDCASKGKDEVDYIFLKAEIFNKENNFDVVEKLLNSAYHIDSEHTINYLVRFYRERGRDGNARKIAEQYVREFPDRAAGYGLLAEVLYLQGKADDAINVVNRGLKNDPYRLSLLRQKAGILLSTEKFDLALGMLENLKKKANNKNFNSLIVEIYNRCGQYGDAVAVAKENFDSTPSDINSLLLYISTLERSGDIDIAIRVLTENLSRHGKNINFLQKLSKLHVLAGNPGAAKALLKEFMGESSQINPHVFEAIIDIAISQRLDDEANELISDAIQKFPKNVNFRKAYISLEKKREDDQAQRLAWLQLIEDFHPRNWPIDGVNELIRLGLSNEVQEALNKWRQEEPKSLTPWWFAFKFTKESKNETRALKILEKLEQLGGKTANIHYERHNIYQEAWQLSSALHELELAIKLRPVDIRFQKAMFALKVKSGDFSGLDELMKKLKILLGDRRYAEYANLFFNINCHPDWSEDVIWEFYRDWYNKAVKPNVVTPLPYANSLVENKKLRIGYVSPDFRRHACAYFIEPLVMHHDNEQFELFAYAHLDPGQEDEYTNRFKSYFENWCNIRGMSNDELDKRIREDKIDILVDLAGHTANNRLSLFTLKPAPIQVGFLIGAGQTTGLPEIDYLVADSFILPEGFQRFCSEKIFRLPFCGGPYKPPPEALSPKSLPSIKNGFITFATLVRPIRLSSQSLQNWVNILKRVGGSVLRFDHIPYEQQEVVERIQDFFVKRGISSERLIFKNTRPHWVAYQEVDIVLDTHPSGSGTVSTEALYMGRLVVTKLSRPPMGRSTASQLMALGLEDYCVAHSDSDYVEKAVALATNHSLLREISSGLRERMESSVLMDYNNYADEIGKMYRKIWSDYCVKESNS